MDEIIEIIEKINELHICFNQRLQKSFPSRINYSKKQVNHLMDSSELKKIFLDYIENYYQELKIFIQSELYKLDLNLDFRIKERESLDDKLYRYYLGKEKGQIPLQKCVNDIFGMRIITPVNLIESKEFAKICKELKDRKIIYFYYTRHDNKYNGIHLYFKGKSNNYLPWELQLWYTEHETDNRKSHSEHKQGYLRR